MEYVAHTKSEPQPFDSAGQPLYFYLNTKNTCETEIFVKISIPDILLYPLIEKRINILHENRFPVLLYKVSHKKRSRQKNS